MGSYILDVPYKSNGKSAQFFDDRLEFKGNSIRYDEIEILTATRGNTTINTYVGIPLGRSFQVANFPLQINAYSYIRLNLMPRIRHSIY